MVEKIGVIKNPLTIIAIFAAVAEISGTIVLPFVSSDNQSIYVWFLVSFPLLLIVMFFLTLNFNNKVLYAPSDYQNEENFVKSFRYASVSEKVTKLNQSMILSENFNAKSLADFGSHLFAEGSEDEEQSIMTTKTHDYLKLQFKHMFVNEMVFELLRNEFAVDIQRGVSVDALKSSFVLDGVLKKNDLMTNVEVRLIGKEQSNNAYLSQLIEGICNGAIALQNFSCVNVNLLLVVVVDDADADADASREYLSTSINKLIKK